MRVLEREADDLDPLRRRLRAVDRRPRRRDASARPRLVLLRQRGRVAGRRSRLLAARRRGDLVGLPRLGRGDAGPGRGRLLAAAVRGRLRRPGRARSRSCLGGGGGLRDGSRGASRGGGEGWRPARPQGAIRVLVGPWARLRGDAAAAQLEDGPQASGVFAEIGGEGGCRLERPRRSTASRRRAFGPAPAWSRRPAATKSRRPGSSPAAGGRGARRRPACSTRPTCATTTRSRPKAASGDAAAGPMRSPFAYTPRRGPLQAASPGAAVAYLGRAGRRRLPLLEPDRPGRGRDRRGAGRHARRRRPRGAGGGVAGPALALLIASSTRSSSAAARRCWPGSASGRCWARST